MESVPGSTSKLRNAGTLPSGRRGEAIPGTRTACEEVDGGARHLRGSWFQRLGQWSFALYLIQALVLDGFITAIGGRPVGALPELGALAVFVLLAIGLSGVTYHVLERPIERRLRAAWLPARTGPAAGGVGIVDAPDPELRPRPETVDDPR